jgi:hypothetical protein
MKTSVNLYLKEFFLGCEMFQTKVVEKIKTHILGSITFSGKIWYSQTSHRRQHNMAQSPYMLDD